MDLNYTGEEIAFREAVREFMRTSLPKAISYKVQNHKRVERDDNVRWQKILHEKNWIAPGWPVEWGGTGWTAVERPRRPICRPAGGATAWRHGRSG